MEHRHTKSPMQQTVILAGIILAALAGVPFLTSKPIGMYGAADGESARGAAHGFVQRHELSITLHSPEQVAEKILPVVAKHELRQRGLDPFAFVTPGIGRHVLGNEKIPCWNFPLKDVNTRIVVEVLPIEGQIGIGPESFALAFSRNRNGFPTVSMDFDIPSQLRTTAKVTLYNACGTQRIHFGITANGIRGNFRSALGVSPEGQLSLLDRRGLTLDIVDVDVDFRAGNLAGRILQDLANLAHRFGLGPRGLEGYVMRQVRRALGDQNNIAQFSQGLVDALNSTLQRSLTFEQEVLLFNDSMTAQTQLAKLGETDGALDTYWSMSVTGGEPHQCAAGI